MRSIDAEYVRKELARLIDEAATNEITTYKAGYRDGLVAGNNVVIHADDCFAMWEYEGVRGHRCSHCGKTQRFRARSMHFCPNCGYCMVSKRKVFICV